MALPQPKTLSFHGSYLLCNTVDELKDFMCSINYIGLNFSNLLHISLIIDVLPLLNVLIDAFEQTVEARVNR
jgi:hypothetical protein